MSEQATSPDEVLSTDYEVGQDNVRVLGLDIHNPVFFISAVTIVAFVILTLIFRESAGEFFGTAVCVESDDGTDRTAFDVGVPAPWQIYYYLIRPLNACGEGALGSVSGGTTRTAISCPVGP